MYLTNDRGATPQFLTKILVDTVVVEHTADGRMHATGVVFVALNSCFKTGQLHACYFHISSDTEDQEELTKLLKNGRLRLRDVVTVATSDKANSQFALSSVTLQANTNSTRFNLFLG